MKRNAGYVIDNPCQEDNSLVRKAILCKYWCVCESSVSSSSKEQGFHGFQGLQTHQPSGPDGVKQIVLKNCWPTLW